MLRITNPNNNDPKYSFFAKNRYEILFFNKETLCSLLYVSKIIMPNTIIEEIKKKRGNLTKDSKTNITLSNKNISESNKSSIQKISSFFFKLIIHKEKNEKENSNKKESLEKKNNINKKMCIHFKQNQHISFNINLQTEYFKDIYNILKNFCYARMYFRYTNRDTFLQRFLKNGDKDRKKFNYIKEYNSFTFLNIFKNFIILNLKKEYKIDNDQIKKYYDKYGGDSVKKLTNEDNKKIDMILNSPVTNEESHYENIKSVLTYIKARTDNFIDYCIVLDIKKNKIFNINSIEKKKNILNNSRQNKINPNPSAMESTIQNIIDIANIPKKVKEVIYVSKMTMGAIIIVVVYIFAVVINLLSIGSTFQGKTVLQEIMDALFETLSGYGINYNFR
jgi:hypothetical protein